MSETTLYIKMLGKFSIKNGYSHFTHIKIIKVSRSPGFFLILLPTRIQKFQKIN